MGRKLTIEEMQEIAKSRGGKCLSKKYVNSRTKLEWECAEGHRWEVLPNDVKRGSWCSQCAGNKKLTIEEMQEFAKSRGGKCLSRKYKGNKSKLEWECAEGHRWKALPKGHWCPKCAGLKKLTIEEMQEIAKSRGGKCLSKKYVNSRTKLEWECAKGHRWDALPNNAKRGSWCFICSKALYVHPRTSTIEEMQEIAKSRGGKCLSKKYVNANTKLEWECAEGHRWKSKSANVVYSGSWCPECSGNLTDTIEEMQEIAKSRGGKCLSKKYVNANTKLEWECAEGHRWKSKPVNVVYSESWCPECESGISERICRAYFRQLFGKPFPKSRPRWLKNLRGNQMELDGYCKDLRIAFEHQGEQHYSATSHFIETQNQLQRRKKDDKDKSNLCKKNGVRLFAVPQLFSRTKLEELQRFIYDECKRLKVRRPAGMLDKQINLKSAWSSKRTKRKYEQMLEFAKSRGGKCLSKKYVNMKTKLEWECAEGHRWKAVPKGHWCSKCAGLKKLTIEEMQEIAKSRGGKCLSKKYVNSRTKLEWECAEGHRWKSKPANVRTSGSWCPKCARKRK